MTAGVEKAAETVNILQKLNEELHSDHDRHMFFEGFKTVHPVDWST